jgi:hypothetical protein
VTSRLPYCPLFPSGLLWRKLCIDGICARQLEVAEGRGRKDEGRGTRDEEGEDWGFCGEASVPRFRARAPPPACALEGGVRRCLAG